MIGLIWFSFLRDSLSVVESVRCARKHFTNQPFLIVNDARYPIAQLQQDILKKLGCEIVDSSFRRGGNLQGGECIKAQLNHYLDFAKSNKLTHVLKVDSDTVILKKEWINCDYDAIGFGYKHYWQQHNYDHFCGMAYVLSVDAIKQILAIEEIPHIGEDAFISQSVFKLGLNSKIYQVTPQNKLGISYKWQDNNFDYSNCWVVTVGQGHIGRRCDNLEAEAIAMHQLERL